MTPETRLPSPIDSAICACTSILIECPYNWEPDPVLASAACLTYTEACVEIRDRFQACKAAGNPIAQCRSDARESHSAAVGAYQAAILAACVANEDAPNQDAATEGGPG